ncbi:MAG TPA: class I SAM-dependent methyltransferase [Pirellulales bacterium]|nr:class I SAM-dependent methyltransferase [Pirellulales bacterium]
MNKPAAGSADIHTAVNHGCDLCGEERFDEIARRDRRVQPLATVVCRCCGLVQHAILPSAQELDTFYAHEYRRQYKGEVSPSPRRIMRAWRKGELILERLTPHLAPGERILEVGSGIGCTVQVFDLAGYDAQGIEPNEGFCAYGATKLHARVRIAYLADVPAEPQFDVVLLVHVIEHLASPRQALAQIFQMLRPGGRLYLECPNFAAPFAAVEQMLHFGHIYNFTRGTLEAAARRAGFEVAAEYALADDPNLRLLLRKATPQESFLPADGYATTMAALRRGSVAHYHLRADYLRMRLGMLRRYVGEYLFAPRFVRRRIALCAASARARELRMASHERSAAA